MLQSLIVEDTPPGIRSISTFLLLGALVLCLATGPAEAYEFESFEVTGAPITGGRGLDDGSCQVGYFQTDASDFSTAHAIRRCNGRIETIDPPTSLADRRAFDINASGVVVGSALRTEGSDGFELDDSTYTWAEFPGAEQTVLRGINDAGDVVGEYVNSGGTRRGFARIGGSFQSIDVPLASETRARGINNLGDVVGEYDDSLGVRHAFSRIGGVFANVDVPAVPSSRARARRSSLVTPSTWRGRPPKASPTGWHTAPTGCGAWRSRSRSSRSASSEWHRSPLPKTAPKGDARRRVTPSSAGGRRRARRSPCAPAGGSSASSARAASAKSGWRSTPRPANGGRSSSAWKHDGCGP